MAPHSVVHVADVAGWAEAGAHLLAERHAEPAPIDPGQSVLKAAEVSHQGDWSLRSALVRLAQPEPIRAGAVLEVVRRCDAALTPLIRSLERHSVWCQPSLSPDLLIDNGDTWALVDDGVRRADTRLADLVRLSGCHDALLDPLLAAYHRIAPLDEEETSALGFVVVAAGVEDIADLVTTWARSFRHPPPAAEIDRLTKALADHLDQLGVPRQTGPDHDGAGSQPAPRRPPRGTRG